MCHMGLYCTDSKNRIKSSQVLMCKLFMKTVTGIGTLLQIELSLIKNIDGKQK